MSEKKHEHTIPPREVGCKLCNKSIYRIFVEHIQAELDNKKES